MIFWATSLVMAGGLLLAAEGLLRVALRIGEGAWPHTATIVRFERQQEINALYRRHPFLNVAPQGGATVAVAGKRASFNSLGYRSPERPRAKPAGVVRILCSGGSTTFDLLAESNQATWPERLEGRLRTAGRIEVWNAGFPGWTSLENTISLLVRDVDLDPDLAILFQGINDLQPAAHRPFDPQYVEGHAQRLVEALGFDLRAPAWFQRSVLVERLGNGLRGDSPPRRPDLGSERAVAPGALGVFARNVRSYVAISRDHGIRPILVTQSLRIRDAQRQSDLDYLGQWLEPLAPEVGPGELERFNEALRRIARDEGVELADAARDVEFDDADFDDPMHFSATGSEKFAAYLAERLTPPGPSRTLSPAAAGRGSGEPSSSP